VIEQVRHDILSGEKPLEGDVFMPIVIEVREQVETLLNPFYRRVVNAAGIVLHTGLGRAVLPAAAMRQLQQEMGGYSLLQVSVEDGKRSARDEQVERLPKRPRWSITTPPRPHWC
jgi:L-seryl-tRNA(Ser) seleniumtransferase